MPGRSATSPRADAVPAAGPTVLVTRPGDQAATWVHDLRARGIDAVATPLIGIAPAPDAAAVDAIWAAIDTWSLLVFVSPNAVGQFFARRPAGRAWPDHLRAAAPGPGTSALLREQGLADDRLVEPAADATQFDSEALWQQLHAADWRGERVLLVRGEGGRDWLAERLREAGAEVHAVAAYRRGPPMPTASERAAMRQALTRPADHLWFFSSSEAVAHLTQLDLQAPTPPAARWHASRALATHPRIAEAARAAGFGTVAQSRPGLPEVIACIQSMARLDCSSAPRRAT